MLYFLVIKLIKVFEENKIFLNHKFYHFAISIHLKCIIKAKSKINN